MVSEGLNEQRSKMFKFYQNGKTMAFLILSLIVVAPDVDASNSRQNMMTT